MSIKAYELKKAAASPIVMGLILVFITFNIFVICSNTYYNDDLKVLNKIVDKFGYEINDSMLNNFQRYYEDELKKVNEITYAKTAKTYSSAGELLQDHSRYEFYSKEQQSFFRSTGVIENYYNIAKNIDESYKAINITDMGKDGVTTYRLSGQAAETVRKQYNKLAVRFEQLKDNGEHKNLFFIGKAYRMHKFLFGTLFRNSIIEIGILVVLITGYLLSYEFENRTQLMAYSTKRGRKLDRDKLFTAIFLSIAITTIILGVSLVVYFAVFDYSGLWKVPISSGFNWEYGLPYISWWKMSLVQYMICCIVLVYLCEIIFTFIAYSISCFIRNSYMVCFIFAVLGGFAFVIPSLMPSYSNAIFAAQFTPFVLCGYCMEWFMEKGAMAPFKYYELITVMVWSVIVIILYSICNGRFKKQNIY